MKPPRLFGWIVVMLLACVSVGCGGHRSASKASVSASPTASPSAFSASTAEATVRAYYGYLARHDAVAAAGLMDPGLARQYMSAPDSELHNVVSLSRVRDLTSAPAPATSDLQAGYTEITQIFVTYDVVYRHEVAALNGANSRFIYLGRNTAGEWRILEIGTGP